MHDPENCPTTPLKNYGPSQTAILIGLITSRCLEKELAFLPRTQRRPTVDELEKAAEVEPTILTYSANFLPFT